jgi:hypothetical protein
LRRRRRRGLLLLLVAERILVLVIARTLREGRGGDERERDGKRENATAELRHDGSL